jgi:hypothetical protein
MCVTIAGAVCQTIHYSYHGPLIGIVSGCLLSHDIQIVGWENDMKSSISMKSWKANNGLSALLFVTFALTVLSWSVIGVSTPSSLGSLTSPANGNITYDKGANVIIVVGYSTRTPCTFNDVWNADKAGTFELVNARDITGADGAAVAVDHALRSTDMYVLGIGDVYITITSFTANSIIQIVGTDECGVPQTENIAITGDGTYNSTFYWRTITTTQVTVFGGNFTYTLTQGQWGVVWKQATNQYEFDAKLVIGDGATATYFTDTNKQIVFTSTVLTAVGQYWLECKTGSTVTFGFCTNVASRSTTF